MESRHVVVGNDSVRRPLKPWTPTVHALLRHLHSCGLSVPLPLGVDDTYEYVTVVRGVGGDDRWPEEPSVIGVRSMGRLLRRVHDATRGWTPPVDAQWSVPFRPSATICHGDPKPGNLAWRGDEAVGLFDWDAARPGDPAEDLAYALLWAVPVDVGQASGTSATTPGTAVARSEALLDGYGWTGPMDVVESAVARHLMAIDEVEWLGAHGHEPHATWVREGWPATWRHNLAGVRR